MSTPTRRLRAAAVQFESQPGNVEANFRVMERFIRQAKDQDVELLVFPECCVTGYWFLRHLTVDQLAGLAEPVPHGPTTRHLIELARQFGLSLGAGLVEVAADGCFYNTYVVAFPNGTWRRHRKLHAFEHPAIRSGSEYTVFELPGGFRAGILICYDCNLIENVRLTALKGADILIAPHQTGGVRSKNPHLMGLIDRTLWDQRHAHPEAIEAQFRGDKGRGWLMRWLPSRAHDNGMFLVFSNGVGMDDDEVRTGNAMILDPYGRILSETGVAADAMVIADLDPGLLAEATGRKWIQARRPELYHAMGIPTGNERDTRLLKFEE